MKIPTTPREVRAMRPNRKHLRCWAGALGAVVPLFGSVEALAADGQVWTVIESRVPASDVGGIVPDHLRVVTESRFGGPREGLSFLLVRGGPMWKLHDHFAFNLNGVQSLEAGSDGVLRPETRLEPEPNIRGSIGAFNLNLRQRFDFRWEQAEISPRYRVQARVSYRPDGASIMPFAASELFVVTQARVSEARNVAGLSFFAPADVRVDVAYMWRPRRDDADWTVTHAAVLTVTFTPKVEPIFEAGGG